MYVSCQDPTPKPFLYEQYLHLLPLTITISTTRLGETIAKKPHEFARDGKGICSSDAITAKNGGR